MRTLSSIAVIVAVLATALLTVDGWYPLVAGAPSRPVPTATARALLDRAATHALAGRIDELCAMGDSPRSCQQSVADLGARRGIPRQPPRVLATEIILPNTDNGGGTVLVVGGRRRDGTRYRTDFFVHDAGVYGFKPADPVWWSGERVPSPAGSRAIPKGAVPVPRPSPSAPAPRRSERQG
ncbi:MAG: hypothetical protein M3425_03020 [Actinomycetota bacterium]|jgi:hypothetical protein|nr:hypothetical protein [Actinomycetota bacterium]